MAMECPGDLPEVRPIKKRPSAYLKSASASASASARPSTTVRRKPASAVTGGQYIKLRYSSTKAIGIRLRGGHQVMQVQMIGQPESTIEGWADECIRRLESGMTIENVKTWVQRQKNRVREDVAD